MFQPRSRPSSVSGKQLGLDKLVKSLSRLGRCCYSMGKYSVTFIWIRGEVCLNPAENALTSIHELLTCCQSRSLWPGWPGTDLKREDFHRRIEELQRAMGSPRKRIKDSKSFCSSLEHRHGCELRLFAWRMQLTDQTWSQCSGHVARSGEGNRLDSQHVSSPPQEPRSARVPLAYPRYRSDYIIELVASGPVHGQELLALGGKRNLFLQ